MTDLVERLRRKPAGGPFKHMLVNPDGPEAASTIEALSGRIAVLLAVVDQYRNAPYRSADWLANEVMTILGVVANDAHPLTPDLSQ